MENFSPSEFEQVEKKIDLLKQMQSIDSQTALNQVKSKIEKPFIERFIQLTLKVAGILLIPLITIVIWQRIELNNQQHVVNTIETPATLRSSFHLPDGTTVWLNGNSTLSYPTKFDSKKRVVKLTGEAYFDVVTNPKQPFNVEIGALTVEAVGTKFNCLSNEKTNNINVLLVEGKVNLFSNHNNSLKKLSTLHPNELVTYNQTEKKATHRKVNPEKHIAWINGRLIFKDDPLQNVLYKLEKWYNVEFTSIENLNNEYAFTGSFADEDLTQILSYIELTTPITFEYKKNTTNNLDTKRRIEIHSK